MQQTLREHYDLVIVGAGPVGLTAANLAHGHGLTVLVLEKEVRPYPLPRAIHFNGDAMRIFQGAGVADMLRPQIGVQRGTTILGADGEPNMRLHFEEDDSTGWHTQYSFYQPLLEATLRDALLGRSGVDIRYASDATALTQDGACVRVEIAGPQGPATTSAAYVLACDGARSPARAQFGIAMEDLGTCENWVVVDIFVGDDFPYPPDRTLIFSDPEQPAVHVPGPGTHRRFEWQLAADEDPQAANTREAVTATLRRWIDVDRVEIIRHAAYTFKSLIAERWRADRVFLAGDAAHLTPPFLGQGMGHGVRDVVNLVWKLAACVRGADPALLDSYETEREPHVRQVIRRSQEVGRGMSIRDPEAARGRDAEMRAAGPLDRQDRAKLMPPLASGFLGGGAAAGQMFPQPRIDTADGKVRLDDIVGTRAAVITRGDLPDAARTLLEQSPGICWIALSPVASPGAVVLQCDGLMRWLSDAGADIVVVRPDRHVFDHAAAADAGALVRRYLAGVEPAA